MGAPNGFPIFPVLIFAAGFATAMAFAALAVIAANHLSSRAAITSQQATLPEFIEFSPEIAK